TTMIRLAREGKPLRVVSDQRVGPTAARDLALGIALLVTAPLPFGIWHLTNAGNVSWYEFARKIFELSGLTPDLSPIPLSLYRPAAPRSPFSVLSNDKAHGAGIILPSWEEALAGYLGRSGLIPGS
ncbi:MAG: sugar nucleotide-binding protein, partial [Nitrospiraceae bacterium]|nr:sugar nucleotide-binding protein [Nitrospiraceae bacterium]